MTKRTERAQRTQAENGAGPALAHLVEPMLAGMTTTRQHLLAWVHAHGLAALDELFCEEAVVLAGAKGRHQAQRTHHYWGTAPTELTFGGRRGQGRGPQGPPATGGGARPPPGRGGSGGRPPAPAARPQPPPRGAPRRARW